MKPGPKIYYKCTKCGKITKRGSFLSANTCGSILYSDGKRVAPMYPVFPAIIKCKNCSTFYWLDKETKIGLECPEDWSKAYYSKNENEIYTKYPEAYSAEFLSVDEYNPHFAVVILKEVF